MKKVPFKAFIKSIGNSMVKNQGSILIGVGLTCLLSATITAITATPKAVKLIEEEKENKNTDKLTVPETIKATWKCYIYTGVLTTLGIASILYANKAHIQKSTALASAYALSESTFKDYREKVAETIGENKEHYIREKAETEKIKKQPKDSEIIVTGNGDYLCYDSWGGRSFYSDINKIKQAFNEVNAMMFDEMTVSLNDLYSELGLPETSGGDQLGWNVNKGTIKPLFSSGLSSDNRPCLVVSFENNPSPNYLDW